MIVRVTPYETLTKAIVVETKRGVVRKFKQTIEERRQCMEWITQLLETGTSFQVRYE